MLLPHGKELIGFLPLTELYTEYKEHERLQVFAKKGLECVSCDRVGALLALGRESGRGGRVHIDLYTDDFVLMTVDHIIPKAICKEFNWTTEERESIKNKQPMCDPCNNSKGHKLISEWDMPAVRAEKIRQRNQNETIQGTELVRQLVPNIHALLGDPV